VTPLRTVERASLALAFATLAGVVVELWRIGPGFDLPFLALLITWLAVLTSVWTVPVAGALIGGRALARWLAPGARADAIVWVPPVVLACVSVGRGVLSWGKQAFVRQDLANAILPVVLLIAYALIVIGALIAHRLLRARLARLRPWVVVAIAAIAAIAATIIHVRRYPALLDDARLPMLVEIVVISALACVVFAAVRTWRWPRLQPGRRLVIAQAAATFVGTLVCLFAGSIAPLRFPIVQAAVQTHGLAAAPAARTLAKLGDRDRDGFPAWFGGLDCDDGDPAVSPLARDVPGDGIDQDCFEGDLTQAAVDAAARPARPAPPRRVRNVVLIAVDTLRADALGFGGSGHASSPRLDALAARGAVFSRAYTQAPMTRRAFPSLLSGRFPSNVHWLDLQTSYPYTVSHDDNVYLAEVLQTSGVATAMSVAFNYAAKSRFDQGFVDKRVHPASRAKQERNANLIVDGAVEYVGAHATENAGGFFLWMHFYEPHYPYVRYQGDGDLGASTWLRYLSEVRSVDGEIGRFLDELARLGLADDTAVIVTADHGEEFDEHGGKFHGDLYPEDLHVPMVIYVPGAAPSRHDAPVALIDLAPTITDLFGVAAAPSFDGRSLLPQVDGEDAPPAPVFAELMPDKKVPRRMFTVIDGGWQLIVDFALGARELYHLDADPFAQRNVLADDPAQASRLEGLLRRALATRFGHVVVEQAGKKSKPKPKPDDDDNPEE